VRDVYVCEPILLNEYEEVLKDLGKNPLELGCKFETAREFNSPRSTQSDAEGLGMS
jgi:hypothetical protein